MPPSDAPAAPAAGPTRVRFPLSWKVILWFLLNVLFLIAVAAIFAQAQLRLRLDSLLAGSAGERLQALTEHIIVDLRDRPRTEWTPRLQRIASQYRAQIALFLDNGEQLAGEITTPPPEVMARMREGEGRRGGPPPPPGGPGGFFDPMHRPPPPEFGEGPQGYPKSIQRGGSPQQYWIGVRVPMSEFELGPRRPTTLLIATRSLSSGGLLFDLKPWLLAGAGVLLCSVVFWIPLVRGITRTIGRMTAAAGDIAQGKFETQVETRRSDELGVLGGSLNHMAERLREFVTGQKRFLGDIAHELCSPLARMELALGVLEQRADEKQRAYVEDVREEVRLMSGLVNELLSFSKAGVQGREVELRDVPLAALVGKVVEREARASDAVKVEIDAALTVLAEPELLARAIANVVRNAIRYAGAAGPIRIAAYARGEDAVLTITDRGPGVPEATLHRLFDPFFRPEAARTRETGGAGLGLAIVKTCVEACGGTVTARNGEHGGLEMEFRLRRA